MSSADLYVLPSHTENFAVTVAESLACRTPVIASQGTPWSQLSENGAGWWIPIGVEPLAEQLKHSMSLTDSERQGMGEQGRQWMHRDYNWNAIGCKMKVAYEWICGKGDKPDWVRED